MRLLRLSDTRILGRAVCGLRGYEGDETEKFEDLVATGGVQLSQELTVAADACADELAEFFPGTD